MGRGKALIAQRSSRGQVRAYFMLRVPEGWAHDNGLHGGSLEAGRATIRAQFAGWSPKLLALVDAGDAIVPRPIVALPVGHRWAHRPGVTLIGDAAHVMPPFSGEGVNMAMLDATELALALVESDDADGAIARFEQAMFARAREAAEGAMEGCAFVSDAGLTHVLEHFREMGARQSTDGRSISTR